MITSLLISWVVLTLVVLLTAAILPGITVRGFGGALVVAALFGLLNVGIGWLLFIAIGIGTLGLGFVLAFVTRWIVDAILLKLVDAISGSITIASFGHALLAALVMSGIGTLVDWIIRAS
ncbi:MAG TPA: phage holin family protein [Nannocystaceae bacterium]|nr:phage holin family protein [Nannocystaceae bacterium]